MYYSQKNSFSNLISDVYSSLRFSETNLRIRYSVLEVSRCFKLTKSRVNCQFDIQFTILDIFVWYRLCVLLFSQILTYRSFFEFLKLGAFVLSETVCLSYAFFCAFFCALFSSENIDRLSFYLFIDISVLFTFFTESFTHIQLGITILAE